MFSSGGTQILLNSWISTGPAHSVGCHRPVVSTEFAGPVDSGRNTYIFWSPAHPLTHRNPRKLCDDDDDQPDHAQKYKRSRTSFSGSKRGNTKASRKAAKAAAEPKTPSPSANTSKKRPRSSSPPRQTVTVVGEEEDGPSSYPHGLSPCSRCNSKGW